jgi:Zn finger protein HypA/HybF involved in hydrogenase expression
MKKTKLQDKHVNIKLVCVDCRHVFNKVIGPKNFHKDVVCPKCASGSVDVYWVKGGI